MHKIMGWTSILVLYAIMVFMMVMGLEIMDGLRNTQLKLSITIMIVVLWIMGGFIAYGIHEFIREETPR